MKLKLIIDKHVCIGAQSCVVEDPEIFELNEQDGRAQMKDKNGERTRELIIEVTEEQKQKLLNTARLCPTQAIQVYSEDGTQLFPS